MSDAVTRILVQGTFVLLIAASALTWALVILKALQQWRLARQDSEFARAFELEKERALPTAGDVAKYTGPVARVALAGVTAWGESGAASGASPEGAALDVRRDLLERSLRRQLQRERRHVDAGLPIRLAGTGVDRADLLGCKREPNNPHLW